MNGQGDCFTVAAELAGCFDTVPGEFASDPTTRVCHAMVSRPDDGLRHAHAWVERSLTQQVPDDWNWPVDSFVVVTVYDKSNGHDVAFPAELYYKIGQVIDVYRYTVDEAKRHMRRTKHYGPWENITPGSARSIARRR